jgi:hypothetical protein
VLPARRRNHRVGDIVGDAVPTEMSNATETVGPTKNT